MTPRTDVLGPRDDARLQGRRGGSRSPRSFHLGQLLGEHGRGQLELGEGGSQGLIGVRIRDGAPR